MPLEPHHTSENLTLNIKRPNPTPAEPIHSNRATTSPHATAPRQTFNHDGTRKYLNIRLAGGQPFPLKKGKKYLAADYENGVMIKRKGEGAASFAPKRKAATNRIVGSCSPTQDKKRGIKQEVGATSREPCSLESDSSPERPLIEVSRSSRKDGGRVEDAANGGVGRSSDNGEKSEDDRGRKRGREGEKRSREARGVRREGH